MIELTSTLVSRLSNFRLILLKGLLTVGALFFCSNLQSSSIDSKFKWHRLKEPQASVSAGVDSYRGFLAPILGTDCKMYPSDSVYANHLLKFCNPLNVSIRAFARFSSERDLHKFFRRPILIDSKLHFEDLPRSCEWFD